MIALAALNRMTQAEFRDALADVFEHSPWVPERAWGRRPFASAEALHGALCDVVTVATRNEQETLIRAHPQLAGKAALRGQLTAASMQEQGSAGLAHCNADELAQLTRLNSAYLERFGFPFILAVRGHTRPGILQALELRLARSQDEEFAEALDQIGRIARFRLTERIDAADKRS